MASQSHLPRSIFWRAELDHGAAHLDAVAQDLAGDGAGGDAHRGLARRLAAAAAIVAHAVFLEVGVVGVARAELVLDLANSRCERWSTLSMCSAIGVPVVTPSNTPDRIFTVSGSWRWVTKRDWPGRRLSIQTWMSASLSGNARRHAVDHAADRRPVAFAPAREPEEGTETVAGHGRRPPSYSPSKLPSSSAICLADEVLIMPTTW